MFDRATAFNADISAWNTSSVTNMYYMFYKATAFNATSLWDTSSVTNMGNMFDRATAFNADISAWDTSSVTIEKHVSAGDVVQRTSLRGTRVCHEHVQHVL